MYKFKSYFSYSNAINVKMAVAYWQAPIGTSVSKISCMDLFFIVDPTVIPLIKRSFTV